MTIAEIEDLISKHGSITAQPLMDLVVMTRDDIIRMAREACAKVCEKIEETCWESWDTQCDPLDQGSAIGAAHCAAAIRARGEQE